MDFNEGFTENEDFRKELSCYRQFKDYNEKTGYLC